VKNVLIILEFGGFGSIGCQVAKSVYHARKFFTTGSIKV
jgi:hypothetical protein